ncbi:hypothetical protein A0256_11365 [Mucilaginibacter sp. PAMC 26640]|nr:hypothetical protein A0256_11365 [Mucilaginibacter sp. PAMC 26640]
MNEIELMRAAIDLMQTTNDLMSKRIDTLEKIIDIYSARFESLDNFCLGQSEHLVLTMDRLTDLAERVNNL